MKFCVNCGRVLNDSDKFCSDCGTPQLNADYVRTEQPSRNYEYSYEQKEYTYDSRDDDRPEYAYDVNYVEQQIQKMYGGQDVSVDKVVRKRKRKALPAFTKKYVPLFGAAVVLLIVLIVFLLIGVIGGGSITKTGAVRAYYKAIQSDDGADMIDATMSAGILRAIMEDTDYTKEHIVQVINTPNGFSSLIGSGRRGKYRNVKVTDKEKYDDEDVEYIESRIENKTGVRVSISSIWNEYYEEWRDGEGSLTLYKSGGKWYVLPDRFNYIK